MTSFRRHGSKPHVSLLHWIGPAGHKHAVWICESNAQSSDWIYAMGETPRSAWNHWNEERARVQHERRKREALRLQYLNRGRVHTKGFGA